MDEYKEYKHNPPHLFRKNSKYFITAKTYKGYKHFTTDSAKQLLIDSIFTTFTKFNWIIEDWVVLDNHYHLMAEVKDNPNDLSKIIRNIHRYTAIEIKKLNPETRSAEKIWYNYWDTCITFESLYYTRINYIWFNPVKHGYVEDPIDWKFGSYYYRFKDDPDYIKKIVKKYPCDIIDLE
ncbi:transposase [candidate division KSB1 bacterium]|nr:transposase [candidate division KSB1 bacterium]